MKTFDFDKAMENYLATLTPEQREFRDRYIALEEANTFYQTTTMLDDDYNKVKYKKETKEVEQEVKLYKPVYKNKENLEVGDKVLISFGGYREYAFDKRFVDSLLEKLKDPELRFCIDAGMEVYVKNSEMVRILQESAKALEDKDIIIAEDYNSEFRKTSMGNMLEKMNLI